MFVACESFIPFADVHHLSYAIRKINNLKFRYNSIHTQIMLLSNQKTNPVYLEQKLIKVEGQ
jgi:hypothetical protein